MRAFPQTAPKTAPTWVEPRPYLAKAKKVRGAESVPQWARLRGMGAVWAQFGRNSAQPQVVALIRVIQVVGAVGSVFTIERHIGKRREKR